MPDDKPQIPPPRFAVREFTTPNPADGFYSEVFKRTDPAYLKLQVPKRGMLYSSIQGAKPEVIAAFPNLYFLKESRLGTSHEWVVWIWASDTNADDTYNSDVSYVDESLAAPQFVRVYEIRRDVWDATPTPVSLLAVMPGLVAIKVTAGGSNYSDDTVVTFAGGTGSGGAAIPVISGGVIKSVIVTNEGTYTAVPTIGFSGTTGSGATATALIQPASAKLVSQKKMEFPEDHPLRNEYVRVVRTYMTLPGPVLTGSRIDERTGNAVNFTRQLVASGSVSGTDVNIFGGYTAINPKTAAIDEVVTDFTIGHALVDSGGQTWTEGRHVPLPRVLEYFQAYDFLDTDGNTVFNGFGQAMANFSGAYVVTIVEQWRNSPWSGLSITNLQPQSFEFITPLGNGGIAECLHDQIEIIGNTASDGSTPAGNGRFYAAISWDFIFNATTPATLSGTITLVDEQRPAYGGWLRRTETITI